ncbi:MAG: hypothetical protein ABSA11_12030 [Candidatus Bathyarchaeia archaeon]
MKRSDRPRGMTATGKTREAVIVFFDAVIERRFSDADKALEEVRNRKNPNPEFQDGYIKALEGILTSARSGDERDFFNRISNTEEGLDKQSRDFREILLKGRPKPFDLGFFSAWSDLVHYRLATNKFLKVTQA